MHGATGAYLTYSLPATHLLEGIGEYINVGAVWAYKGRGGKGKGRPGVGLCRIIVLVPGSTTNAVAIIVVGRDVCTKWRAGACTFHKCKFYHFLPAVLVTALPGQNPQCIGVAGINLRSNRVISNKLGYTNKQNDEYKDLMEEACRTVKRDTRAKKQEKAEARRLDKMMTAAQKASSSEVSDSDGVFFSLMRSPCLAKKG